MEDTQALALFNEILTRTKEGRVPWEPLGSDTLLAAIKGKRSLLLMPYTGTDSWGKEWGGASLTVKDSSDRELLRVTNEIEGVRSEALQELYETARKQAFKVDEQVQDLLSDLRSL
jgi:hypothetical protein